MAISSLMHGRHLLLQSMFHVPIWALVVVPVGWFCVVWVLGVGVLQVFGANVAWLLNRGCALCPSCLWDVPLALVHPSARESLFATCFQFSSSLRTSLLHT